MNLFGQFKTWYLKYRNFLDTWFSRDRQQPTPPTPSLAELPPEIAQSLKDKVQALPTHTAIQDAIGDKIDTAIKQWRENPTIATNSLVILSSSAEPIARMLSESLTDWPKQSDIPLRLLQWTARPSDPTTLQNTLVTQLGRGLPLGSERQPEIVVIPNLSWCFLRCAEGLGGIDYLRDTVLSERSRFWIVGCGTVAWNYLNLVCKVAAYYQQQWWVPPLNSEHLQQWLDPIIKQMGIEFDYRQQNPKVLPKTEDKSDRQRYFEKLAEVSEGASPVALQLFLRSLVYQESKDGETREETGKIIAQKPKLPSLPALSSDEHYLLYSLLLHGDLSLSHLAESLGDDMATVQNLVQILRRQGAIEEQNDLLEVNPLHYPKLKDELDGNNFLMAEDEG